jgi:hypothetical protein
MRSAEMRKCLKLLARSSLMNCNTIIQRGGKTLSYLPVMEYSLLWQYADAQLHSFLKSYRETFHRFTHISDCIKEIVFIIC